MAGLLDIAYDPTSLGKLSQLPGLGSLIEQNMSEVLLNDVGELLANAMTTNTWENFLNPQGQLADAIEPYLASPLELVIAVNVPYAWRMEAGFHGADSLGRIYDEEGKPYAQPALDDTADQIAAVMNLAVASAVAQLQGGK